MPSTAASWSLSTQAVTGQLPGLPSLTTGTPDRYSSLTRGSWSGGSITTVPSRAMLPQTSWREEAGSTTSA